VVPGTGVAPTAVIPGAGDGVGSDVVGDEVDGEPPNVVPPPVLVPAPQPAKTATARNAAPGKRKLRFNLSAFQMG
jgi:hypothetical protein